jgi:hypothetical protein
MKPGTEELRRLLAARPVPEPSAEARARALQAALAEQRRVAAWEAREARVKGSEAAGRHTGRPHKGGPVMKKLGYALGGLALAGIAAAIILPNFLQFRMKAKAPGSGRQFDEYAVMLGGAPAGAPVVMSRKDAVYSSPPIQEYAGRDRFEKITDNPVRVTAEEPVSTFSIDVDTASYAFVRRAL